MMKNQIGGYVRRRSLLMLLALVIPPSVMAQPVASRVVKIRQRVIGLRIFLLPTLLLWILLRRMKLLQIKLRWVIGTLGMDWAA